MKNNLWGTSVSIRLSPNSRYLQGWILAGILITVVEYDRLLKKMAKYGVVDFIFDNQYRKRKCLLQVIGVDLST